MLLQLSSAVPTTPIQLAAGEADWLGKGDPARMLGWATDSNCSGDECRPGRLQVADVHALKDCDGLPSRKCKKATHVVLQSSDDDVPHAAFKGDSGGPVIDTSNRLAGVMVDSNWDEGDPPDTTVALRMTKYGAWVSDIMQRSTITPHPSARVIYTGDDQHVHELLLTAGQGWRWSDLTEVIDARDSHSDPAVYITGRNEVRIAFVGAWNGHIYELFQDADGGWHYQDLHLSAGIHRQPDTFAEGNPSGYASPHARVVYRGRDDHVHELFQDTNGKWTHVDLHKLAKVDRESSTAVRGDPMGYASPAPRVVYRSSHNRVHEFFQDPDPTKGWVHVDLNTRAADAPTASGNPVGYSSPSGARVVYRSDDRLHELFQRPEDGTWHHVDLQQLALGDHADTARAAGDPWASAEPLARVLYRDPDKRVHQLVQEPEGTWRHAPLHELAELRHWHEDAESRVASYATPFLAGKLRVVYRGDDEQVHELHQWPGERWTHANLTSLTGAPNAVGNPAGLAVPGHAPPGPHPT